MTYDQACRIHDHLLLTGQAFCFLSTFECVSREDCLAVIDDFNTIK